MLLSTGNKCRALTGVSCVNKITTTLLCVLLIIFAGQQSAIAESYRVVTKHVLFYFNSAEDMVDFSGSIDYPSEVKIGGIFSSPTTEEVKKHLIDKVDRLFKKAQMILDMRKRMPKVKIKVFSNSEQLEKKYVRLYKTKGSPRGWYTFKINTVFLNVEDVHEGMLAHELGHAIIDNYLKVRPPRATAEILAKYVDKNLFEAVKKY